MQSKTLKDKNISHIYKCMRNIIDRNGIKFVRNKRMESLKLHKKDVGICQKE